jgi:hypothetical protein
VTPSGGAATTQLTISNQRAIFLLAAGIGTINAGYDGLPLRMQQGHGVASLAILAVAYGGLGLLFGCTGTSGGGGTSTTSTPASITLMVTLTGISGNPQGKEKIMFTVRPIALPIDTRSPVSFWSRRGVQICPANSKNELNSDRRYYSPALRDACLFIDVGSCLTCDREGTVAGHIDTRNFPDRSI